MVNPKRFYTYAYLREDRTPYYIGKGQKNRINEKCGRRFNIPPKERRIILKRFELEFDAYKHEMYMISVLGRKDLGTGILINRSDGGEGNANHSKETREYFSKLHKGKVLSKETREKISQSRIKANIKVSDELKKELSIKYSGKGNPNYGKKHSPETLAKISVGTRNKNLKTRTYITPSNEIIVIENLREYCEKNDLNYNSMLSIYNGKKQNHKGYEKYTPGKILTYDMKTKDRYLNYKYILTNPNGEIFETFNLNKFCRENNLTPKGIKYICWGKQKTHKNWTATRVLCPLC